MTRSKGYDSAEQLPKNARLTRCERPPPGLFQRVLPEQREPDPAHGERAVAVLGAVVQRGPGRLLRRPPRPQEAAQPHLAPGKHRSEEGLIFVQR